MDLAVAFDNTTGLIQCRKYSPPNEAIFGLGLRGGPINRRGRTFFMRNTDYAGYGEFTDPLYQSYPLYYGLQFGRAYGLFLDSAPTSYFDVANTEPGVLTFGVLQGELDYYLIAGPDPQDISRTYGRLTGNNPLPPKWSLGYHHSRYGWQSEEEIRAVAGQLRAQDFPTDTLWFDVDYLDNRAAFSWNPATFPNPIQFHAELKAAGFRTIYINEPCIRNDDPLWPYMDALGYFLRNGLNQSHLNSIWFGNVSWIDFSNSIAYDWYKTQLRTFLSTGIDGLWNDLNEPANNFMPDAVHDFDGDPRSDTEARNIYALLANKLAYEAQRELRPNVRPWNFSRGGFSGIQRYAHTWGGDAPSTFDSLRVAIQTSISMGLSGQNQFGHDTGGFMGTPSAELFVRWLEFSLFTPLFRNHSINTAAPREPWVYGEPTTSIVRDIIKRRYRMIPYLYTLFEEASRTGRPVLMPIFFYGEDDESTFAQDSEYLFGPYLLVAPVSTPGAITRTLYLPAGSRWINFYTDQVYEGGLEITVDALLGSPPLFVREGGIVVQGEAGRYVDDPETSPDLTIDAYAIAGGFFTLYEDDGNSYDYTNGEYLRTAFQLDVTGSIVQCNAYRLDGTFTPPARNLRFQIHRLMTAPSTVTQNNTALAEFNSLSELEDAGAGWYFDSVAQLLVAIVADAPSVELQIE
jgi:alpha-glucosidase